MPEYNNKIKALQNKVDQTKKTLKEEILNSPKVMNEVNALKKNEEDLANLSNMKDIFKIKSSGKKNTSQKKPPQSNDTSQKKSSESFISKIINFLINLFTAKKSTTKASHADSSPPIEVPKSNIQYLGAGDINNVASDNTKENAPVVEKREKDTIPSINNSGATKSENFKKYEGPPKTYKQEEFFVPFGKTRTINESNKSNNSVPNNTNHKKNGDKDSSSRLVMY